MNWKALLPAATLLVLFVPSAAFSRNHHSGMYQNGMMSQMGNGGQYYGASSHNINPMVSAGMNPYANVNPYAGAPIANVGAYGVNSLASNGFGYAGNNGMLGMNNGMNGMGMCHRHRKHRRRGMLQALFNNGGGYGNSGYGNMGYGNQGMYGNSYGYGGGLTGGLRNMLGRL